ncbi:ABC-F family ATP-binding cassette domain-containing protein [Ethanoligenens sp.]|uniref:ABC-F family ATP-binding cassette domain-containing protein n=1 Tax=Ethanoligenens sp. TaxID=2099655 RepID=UPI0039EA5E3F
MSLLEVTNLSHTFGDKVVFRDTGLSLFRGDKMGLTGYNGAGKSTLLTMLAGITIPDDGRIFWNPKIRVGYLDQQAQIKDADSVGAYLKTAFQYLYDAAAEIERLNGMIVSCKDDVKLQELLQQMGDAQDILDSGNFYAIDSDVEKVAAGLGIKAFGLDTPVSKLSGGQRAKVMLAKLLLQTPDVLLLDEPTNFLDHAHIEWLAKYLAAFKGSFILVSHDFTFLNRVVNCICDIQNYAVTRYNGTYESFVRQKEQRAEEYARNYHRQQKEIAKLEDYVSRNLARASTTAMAQSRRKQLQKMDRLEKPQNDPEPTFQFQYRKVSPKVLVKIRGLEVGYHEQLLPKIDLQIRAGEKVCISGFNGIGKSTFLKTVCGLIPKLGGVLRLDEDTVIGYYEQEHHWEQPERTALAEVKDAFPTLRDKEIRAKLAQCGLRAEHVLQSLSSLSGGEQAKVKICKLVLRPCNLLVLDEPTNHLDVKAIAQLEEAIAAFEGAVVFVSHSSDFCKDIVQKRLDMEALFD